MLVLRASWPTTKRAKWFLIIQAAGTPPEPVATPMVPSSVSISTTSAPSAPMPQLERFSRYFS